MKQSELVAALTEASGDSKAACGRVLDALAPAVRAALLRGGSVVIPGVGKIKLRQAAARAVKTPQGRTVGVPARAVVKFVPAKALRDLVSSDDAPREVLA